MSELNLFEALVLLHKSLEFLRFVKFAIRTAMIVTSAVLLSGCTTSSVLSPAPFEIPSERYAALIINADSKKVLHQTRADAIRFPASLTKMMTMYMAFDALKRKRISLTSRVPISRRAAAKPASKLYFKAGQSISVHKALEAMAIKSANDVASAMAEFLGGSETRFAQSMTRRARALGMSSTTFRNASGLPDKRQVTTARDMAKLGITLRRNFPQYYHYFGNSSFVFRGKTIRGHNRVLKQVRGADGIKTGYTRASGFNLVTSVKTRKGNIIGVILGENSGRIRNKHMVELLKRYAGATPIQKKR